MWQKHKIEENQVYTLTIGQCQCWIEKIDKIWQFAKTMHPDAPAKLAPLSPVLSTDGTLDWNFHVADKHSSVYLLPSVPDRPIIVKPVKKFSILPGMSLEIFIQVPIWIQFYASSIKAENLLLELPSAELSSTWFGEPDNGELAYSCREEIMFSFKLENVLPGSVICPVKIKNEADTSLEFQRLSVPVEQLNVYANAHYLFANEIQVSYKGEDKSTEVHISSGSPSLIEGLKLLNNARNVTNKNLLKKSFSFIKSIADY